MKIALYFILLLPIFCTAQKKPEPLFFDWQRKPCDISLARFMAVAEKTDSGWLRNEYYLSNNNLFTTGFFLDSACKRKKGVFKAFYYNGKLSSVGKYTNNKKNGIWLSYHYNGMMSDSTNFINGVALGTSIKWHSNGYPADSIEYSSPGCGVNVGWFSNGNVSYAGRFIKDTVLDGTWQFFNINGKLAAKETYSNSKITAAEYYDETGAIVNEPENKDFEVSFKGGLGGWKKYLENKLQFPAGYKLVNTNIITVVVSFKIDEVGKVQDAFVEIPFKKPFDDEALRIIQKSPKWLPKIKHNRHVMAYLRQPISFGQQEE